MNQQPDMVTAAENGYARTADAMDAKYQHAHSLLYCELTQEWKKSPRNKVWTPDSLPKHQPVIEVVREYLDCQRDDKEESELLALIADAASGHNVSDRARAFMDRVAIRHADWHAEKAAGA